MSSWASKKYNEWCEAWMPWIEDKYLAWFGENRTSYGVKDTMGKSKISGNENVDKVQDGVNGAVGDTFSSKGPLGFVGEGVDKTGLLGGTKSEVPDAPKLGLPTMLGGKAEEPKEERD